MSSNHTSYTTNLANLTYKKREEMLNAWLRIGTFGNNMIIVWAFAELNTKMLMDNTHLRMYLF